MPDRAWKAWEREAARDHGGLRTGPTGCDDPDVSGLALIGVECKYQGKLSFKEADMQQARDNAAKIGLRPVLLLKERGNVRRAVRLDYDDWLYLYKLALIGAREEGILAGATMAELQEVFVG